MHEKFKMCQNQIIFLEMPVINWETTKSTGLILIKSLTHILKNDFSPQILIFHGYFESCNSYHLFGQVILMSVCLAA